jgi:hypothetical protein
MDRSMSTPGRLPVDVHSDRSLVPPARLELALFDP